MHFLKSVRPNSDLAVAVNRRAKIVLLSIFLLLGLVSVAFADSTRSDDAGILSAQVENDLWGSGSDQYYTHGTRFSYLSSEDAPDWLYQGARYVPVFSRQGRLRTSYAVGQSIFTPADITRSDLIRDDRPYAGWAYAAVGLISDHRVRDGALQSNRLDSLELNLGVIGPLSYTEQTQKAVHDAIGSPEPRGWSHQLRNEPGIMLVYDRQWQAQYLFDAWGLGADVTPHLGGTLGNVMTSLSTGVTLRFGRDLPSDYGPPSIRPSLPGSGFFCPTQAFGWYLFAGASGRLVLHNIFLDGNTFRSSHNVDRELWVNDIKVGLVLTWGRVRLSFSNIFRSDEFEEQGASSEFGSISLSLRM